MEKVRTGVRAATTEAPIKQLGRRLKDARNNADLRQVEAGKKLDVTHSAIGQWERGETMIDTVNLLLAAQEYRESLDWLAFGKMGTIEKRIAALPEGLRELIADQITSALEGAERQAQRMPKVWGDRVIRDGDPRLTEWSAKDKIKTMRKARRRKNS